MKASVIYGIGSPKLILGAQCIGNYGINHNYQNIILLRPRNFRENQNQEFWCQKVTVGNTIGATNVSGVLFNFHVHCVHRITKWWKCSIFRAPKGKSISANPTAGSTSIVRVNRLEFFLEGYDFERKRFLVEDKFLKKVSLFFFFWWSNYTLQIS